MSTKLTSIGAALEAVREVVAACGRSRITSLHFNHAQTSLLVALQTDQERVAFLERLALAHATGEIPDAAYQRILLTVGKILKGSADLTFELGRVCGSRTA